MYYIQSQSNLLYKVKDALEAFFGDKAEVQWSNDKLYVKVKEGFPAEDHPLSPEEVERGMIGGGRIDGLDGKMFCISVEEITEWPFLVPTPTVPPTTE